MTAVAAPPRPRTEQGIRDRRAHVAVLAALGRSDKEIAAVLGVSWRTILRDRAADGIPSTWKPDPVVQPHGTDARYSAGCRCSGCRAAHAARHVETNHAAGRNRRYYRRCEACGARCVVDALDDPVDCACKLQPDLRELGPTAGTGGVCVVDDCDRPVYCRGMCGSHYRRQLYARARARRRAAARAVL
jgi:hypothetical protein